MLKNVLHLLKSPVFCQFNMYGIYCTKEMKADKIFWRKKKKNPVSE